MFLDEKFLNKTRLCDVHNSSKQFHLKLSSRYFLFIVNSCDNAAFQQSLQNRKKKHPWLSKCL